MRASEPVTIVGAGPAGLGAAWALMQAGHENFAVKDEPPRDGGFRLSGWRRKIEVSKPKERKP